MKQIKQTHEIPAGSDKVWDALTNPYQIEQWGAGPATFDNNVGGRFSLWDGDVHGINTRVIPLNLLEQDWYNSDHPDICYKVSFALIGGDNGCTIELTHSNIPDDMSQQEYEDYATGWKDYYFDPITDLLEADEDEE
jgi:uncharacterized protein YndB with AHSA1/START domain